MNSRMDVIENILKSNGIAYKRYEHYFMISCLAGTHKDKHPSMMISESGNIACKTCGFISNVKKLFNLEIIPDAEMTKFEMFATPDTRFAKVESYSIQHENIREFDIPLPPNFKLSVPNSPKRGISVKTLHKYNVLESGSWTIFPIEYDAPDKRVRIGYAIRTDNGWIFSKSLENTTHFSFYVYPMVYPEPTETLFLVEGIFDALALIDKGFKALAMFGGWVYRYNKKTEERLALKESFFVPYTPKNLVLYFDDDPAGWEYSKNAKAFFESRYKVFEFKSEKDPDEFLMEPDNVSKLKDFVNNLERRQKNEEENKKDKNEENEEAEK